MNRLRQAIAFFLAAVALASCGVESEAQLRVVIARADALWTTPDTVEVLVYGSGTACNALIAAADTANDDRCAPGANVEAGGCFLDSVVMAYDANTTTERLVVSVGQRNVLVRGLDDYPDLVAIGCNAVTVKEGEVAAVTVLLSDS